MIHAAREVRVVLRYLHAASSEYAMHCKKKGTKRSSLSKEQRERDLERQRQIKLPREK